MDLHSDRIKELAAAYRWKAENNIRFYEKLNMTTEQKVDFLANEFASIHWLVEIDAPSIKHLKPGLATPFHEGDGERSDETK